LKAIVRSKGVIKEFKRKPRRFILFVMPLVGMLAPAVISRGGIHSFTVIPAGVGRYPSEEKISWILAFTLARRRGNDLIAYKTYLFSIRKLKHYSIIFCRAERRRDDPMGYVLPLDSNGFCVKYHDIIIIMINAKEKANADY
jgi:hypothetical protein